MKQIMQEERHKRTRSLEEQGGVLQTMRLIVDVDGIGQERR